MSPSPLKALPSTQSRNHLFSLSMTRVAMLLASARGISSLRVFSHRHSLHGSPCRAVFLAVCFSLDNCAEHNHTFRSLFLTFFLFQTKVSTDFKTLHCILVHSRDCLQHYSQLLHRPVGAHLRLHLSIFLAFRLHVDSASRDAVCGLHFHTAT